MAIGLFGGSFNPPHGGHVLVAQTALKRLHLDRIWWMVTPNNPLKRTREMPSIDVRLEQSYDLVQSPNIVVTGLEATIGSRYTSDTINYLLPRNRCVSFVLIIGADSLAQFHRWHNWRCIVERIPIAVIDRPSASMAALSSPMAQRYRGARIAEEQAGSLRFRQAPAWCYIHGRQSAQSSTIIRRQQL